MLDSVEYVSQRLTEDGTKYINTFLTDTLYFKLSQGEKKILGIPTVNLCV